jgi:hypothetical protein
LLPSVAILLLSNLKLTKSMFFLCVHGEHMQIVMSLLAIKAPGSPLTKSALTELDAAVLMFSNAASSCAAAAYHLVS